MVHTCVTCNSTFENLRGLNIHRAYCQQKHAVIKKCNEV